MANRCMCTSLAFAEKESGRLFLVL